MNWVEGLDKLDPAWIYLGLFFSAVLENVVPPVPGDAVVVFSAYLVGTGRLDLWPVFFATVFGGQLGFMGMYWLGLKFGRSIFKRRIARTIDSVQVKRVEAWLSRYGNWLVLVNRFFPGIRSLIAVLAGITGMRWLYLCAFGMLSLILWNGLLLYLGILLGKNWADLIEFIQQYVRVLFVLAIVILAVYVFRWRSMS